MTAPTLFAYLWAWLFSFQSLPFPGPGGVAAPPASTAFITTVNTFGTLKNSFTGCIGMNDTVAGASITVTDLGIYVISGNSAVHTLYLRDNTNSVVGSVSVNLSGATANQFLYASITPVVFGSGAGFEVMASETASGDQWHDDDTTTVTTTADASVGSGKFNSNAGCTGASSSDIAGHVYVPVNFKYHL